MASVLEVQKVAVIGAGTMGTGIAQIAARAGYRTAIYDAAEGAARRALDRIGEALARAVERGKCTAQEREEALSRLSNAVDLESAAGEADLVIEAAPEDLALKRELFGRLSRAARGSARKKVCRKRYKNGCRRDRSGVSGSPAVAGRESEDRDLAILLEFRLSPLDRTQDPSGVTFFDPQADGVACRCVGKDGHALGVADHGRDEGEERTRRLRWRRRLDWLDRLRRSRDGRSVGTPGW